MSDLFQGLPDNLPKEEEKSNLPEQLQGKTPEQMYEILSQEHQREVERIKAKQFDEQQQKQQQPQQQQQQQSQQRPSQGYRPRQQPNYYVPPTYPQGQQGQQEQEPDIFTDPDRFMDAQFKKRVEPLAQSYTQSLKETNKQNFRARIGEEEWNKYGEEVEQFMESLSPQVQIQPQAFETAYNFVRAQHVDEIAKEKSEQQASEKLQETLLKLGISPDRLKEVAGQEGQGQQPGSEETVQSLFQRPTGAASSVPHTAASSGGGSTGGNKKGKRRLSDEERRLAEEFGMSEDEYLEYAALNTDLISSLGGGNE